MSSAIQDKVTTVLANDTYRHDTAGYVEFAFFLIDQGIESENIYILAGLGSEPPEERRSWFGKVVADLGIQIPQGD